MLQTILKINDCKWIDVVAPSTEELAELAAEYQIHPVLLEDCLDPEHLPKFEVTSGYLFTIVRAFDEESTTESTSVQQLTRKLVILTKGNVLLTIHRKPLRFLDAYILSIQDSYKDETVVRLYYEICKAAIMTYDEAFVKFEARFEKVEDIISNGKGTVEIFTGVRQEARRLSTIKRLLWHTSAIFQRLPRVQDIERIYAQDLIESLQSLMFFADELAEDASGLVNLELSMYSHRNNQVIRILTLFSVFFMPLTFIVGVYGMNFKVMPELEWRYGYAGVWIVMIATVALIWYWFKKQRWFDD
jgi:magnesium transporter